MDQKTEFSLLQRMGVPVIILRRGIFVVLLSIFLQFFLK